MALKKVTSAQRYLKTRVAGVNGLPVVAGDINPMIDIVNDLNDGSISTTTLTLAGVASGTPALTLTAGDILVTSGDVNMTSGDLTLTSGNIVGTAGNFTLTSGNGILSEGSLSITDTAEERALLVTSSATTADAVHIVASSLTTGAALLIDGNAGAAAIESSSGFVRHGGTSTLAGSGAVPITQPIAECDSTGGGAWTLADGVEGQRLTVVMVTDAGDGTLTPSNAGGYTDITFADAGDSAELLFTNGNWYVIGVGGLAPGPVVA